MSDPYLLTTSIKYLTTGMPYVTIPHTWGLESKMYCEIRIKNRRTRRTRKIVRRTFDRCASLAVYFPMADIKYLAKVTDRAAPDDLFNITVRPLDEDEVAAYLKSGAGQEESK